MNRSSLADWLDERIGQKKLLAALLDHPLAGGARWAHAIGSALAVLFGLELVTGLLLMTSYAPSATTAWASVHYITYRLSAGWFIRGVHYFASQAILVLLAAHLLHTALGGAYRRPREVTWWVGVALFGLTLGLSHTGFMLPWDQKGYWAARIATSIAGTTPLAGPWIQQVLQGGPDYGSLTLTHVYALHAGLLPMLAFGLLAVHVVLFRRSGANVPAGVDAAKREAFFPAQAWKDLVAGAIACGLVFAVVLDRHGAALDAPADPNADYPARPEWYLTPIFELRKHMHGPLELVATMGVPAVVFGYLIALPLIDRAPEARLRERTKSLWPLLVGFAGTVVLLVVSLAGDAKDAGFVKQREQADAFAATAAKLAMKGVPPGGPLEMLANDPELRGASLFAKSCGSCHVLGQVGDRAKATAPALDGWGTEAWAASMLDDPDAHARFGATPFKGMMPSMIQPPLDQKPDDPPFHPMNDADVKATAIFLASQSDADGEAQGARPLKRDPGQVAAGEKVVTVRCTSCHLWKGEGDDSGDGNAPDLAGWGTVAWTKAQIANPAGGTTYRSGALDPKLKGHMPRFDQDLAASDVELLARWVSAHSHGRSL